MNILDDFLDRRRRTNGFGINICFVMKKTEDFDYLVLFTCIMSLNVI